MSHLLNADQRLRRPTSPWSVYTCGLALILILLLAGCSPITRSDQPVGEQWQQLEAGQTAGQTFTARFGGLQSVDFFLRPDQPGQGQIIFHLQANNAVPVGQGRVEGSDLARAVLPVSALTSPGYTKFDFPALSDSQFQDYYAYLEIEGDGRVQVVSGPANSYLEGAFYAEHQPLEAQAAFRLGYDPGLLAVGLLRMGLSWAGILLAGAFLFILPGWGLFSALCPGWREQSWPAKVGLAAGGSLVTYPLLLLWADLVKVRPGPLLAWLPPLLGATLLAWGRIRKANGQGAIGNQGNQQPTAGTQPARVGFASAWAQLAFVGVVALVILSRFWVVRGLAVPMLGDSYQHSMITQLLLDNGGLFNSWQPYAELTSFTYHFGFHSLAAAFTYLSRTPAPQAVLWTGQILNILAVLSLYPLAIKVGRNQWAGVAAVLLAGLLMPMPMAYANWGRYTQLAGQAALPAAVWLCWSLMEKKPAGRGIYILSWLLLGGVALLHYRVLIFALLALPVLMVVYACKSGLPSLLQRVFWAGAGALVLFLPWFLHVYGGAIMGIFKANLGTPAAQLSDASQQYNAIGNLTDYLPTPFWWALPLILVWGLWKREIALAVTSLWWGLIVLAANPHWLGLPGTGSLSNFAVAIAAYIPVGVLLGGASGWLADGLERLGKGTDSWMGWLASQKFQQPALTGLALALALLGARQALGYVNVPGHALVTRADLRAAAWIQENTPPEARFLVNSFRAYSGAAVVGSDAGWWLPLLAERHTTLPPLSYKLEVEPWKGYQKFVGELTDLIHDQGILHPDSLSALKERKVSHVYIGQQQGGVNYQGPTFLDPTQLLSSEHFKLVYHQDRAWVFEFIP